MSAVSLPCDAPAVARGVATRLIRLSALGVALALLGGCAAMSEQECRSANWYEQGQRDALAGQPRSHLGDIREACAEAGVRPSEPMYWEGWNQGIGQFCTPANGARWGRDGKSYHNSCPPELEMGFLARYRDGRTAWDAEQTLRRLQTEQGNKQRELDNTKDDNQRKRLREQLRDMDWRLRNARDDLDRAEWRLRQGY